MRTTSRRGAGRSSWRHHARPPAAAPAAQRIRTPQPSQPTIERRAAPGLPRLDDEAQRALLVKLLGRADEDRRAGRPHRAISDLIRVLAIATGDEDAQLCSAASAALEPLLHSPGAALFDAMIPSRAVADLDAAEGPMPGNAKWSTAKGGVGRHCIYQIKAGSLLFRSGPPRKGMPRPRAEYSRGEPTEETQSGMAGGSAGGSADEALLLSADALRQRQLAGSAATAPPASGGERAVSGVGPQLRAMPCVDARSATGFAAVGAAARAPHAVLIRHSGLCADVAGWDEATLSSELRGATCHVLSAANASRRFTYYWGGSGDPLHGHYDAPPAVTSVGMTFDEFRQRVRASRRCHDASLYLQTGLAQRSPEGELKSMGGLGPRLQAMLATLRAGAAGTDAAAATAEPSPSPPPPPRADASADARAVDLLRHMVREGDFGRYTRTALFVSSPGAVTQLHYDHYDNVYVQLKGCSPPPPPQGHARAKGTPAPERVQRGGGSVRSDSWVGDGGSYSRRLPRRPPKASSLCCSPVLTHTCGITPAMLPRAYPRHWQSPCELTPCGLTPCGLTPCGLTPRMHFSLPGDPPRPPDPRHSSASDASRRTPGRD